MAPIEIFTPGKHTKEPVVAGGQVAAVLNRKMIYFTEAGGGLFAEGEGGTELERLANLERAGLHRNLGDTTIVTDSGAVIKVTR